MTPIIRAAKTSDFAAVSALLQDLGRGELNEASEQVYLERFARHLGRTETASLVAEIDRQVVGFVSIEFRERLNRLKREAWVPDLIVREESRGHGLGCALLLAAFDTAREHGCYRLTLESGHSRYAARKLYLANGMQEEGSFFGVEFSPSKS